MRLRRTVASVALAVASMTAAAVGLSAPAYASVDDPTGLHHIRGWDDSKCLYGNPNHNGTTDVEVYSCHNSPYEQWSVLGPLNHTQLVNNALQLCAEPSQPGTNRSAIQLKPCDANNINQFWNYQPLRKAGEPDGPLIHWVNAGLNNLCMDRPTESDFDGESVQMWVCQPLSTSPYSGNHYEQNGELVQHID